MSFYLVDKVGRRPLLLGGTAFMSLCVFAVGGIGFTTLTDSAGNALVAICALWVAAYSISVAPIGKFNTHHVQHALTSRMGFTG